MTRKPSQRTNLIGWVGRVWVCMVGFFKLSVGCRVYHIKFRVTWQTDLFCFKAEKTPNFLNPTPFFRRDFTPPESRPPLLLFSYRPPFLLLSQLLLLPQSHSSRSTLTPQSSSSSNTADSTCLQRRCLPPQRLWRRFHLVLNDILVAVVRSHPPRPIPPPPVATSFSSSWQL